MARPRRTRLHRSRRTFIRELRRRLRWHDHGRMTDVLDSKSWRTLKEER